MPAVLLAGFTARLTKLIELNALGEVAEKIQDLKTFSAQIAGATDQGARVQETTQGQGEKTMAAARQKLSERA